LDFEDVPAPSLDLKILEKNGMSVRGEEKMDISRVVSGAFASRHPGRLVCRSSIVQTSAKIDGGNRNTQLRRSRCLLSKEGISLTAKVSLPRMGNYGEFQ